MIIKEEHLSRSAHHLIIVVVEELRKIINREDFFDDNPRFHKSNRKVQPSEYNILPHM
jgi:hypothetical protein